MKTATAPPRAKSSCSEGFSVPRMQAFGEAHIVASSAAYTLYHLQPAVEHARQLHRRRHQPRLPHPPLREHVDGTGGAHAPSLLIVGAGLSPVL